MSFFDRLFSCCSSSTTVTVHNETPTQPPSASRHINPPTLADIAIKETPQLSASKVIPREKEREKDRDTSFSAIASVLNDETRSATVFADEYQYLKKTSTFTAQNRKSERSEFFNNKADPSDTSFLLGTLDESTISNNNKTKDKDTTINNNINMSFLHQRTHSRRTSEAPSRVPSKNLSPSLFDQRQFSRESFGGLSRTPSEMKLKGEILIRSIVRDELEEEMGRRPRSKSKKYTREGDQALSRDSNESVKRSTLNETPFLAPARKNSVSNKQSQQKSEKRRQANQVFMGELFFSFEQAASGKVSKE